jgi:predicted glycosyltransferase
MSKGMTKTVFFYVQHLLGVGHLKRASILAREMVNQGLGVTVVLGGPAVKGVEFTGCARVILPSIQAADETFSTLVDADGNPVSDALRDARAARLLTEFEALDPDFVLIEMFPFGRRQFRFELMPLLEAIHGRANPPIVACSVRDILVHKSNPDRNQEMIALATAWFDTILVHGDPLLVPLETSFPDAAFIEHKISYTGYVVDPKAQMSTEGNNRIDGKDEVIVTVGGGAVGEPLLRAAIAARPLSSLSDIPWRIITGPNLDEAVFDELRSAVDEGVVFERWRSDLPVLLKNCRLSISQAGYNTVMDILQANARAVVVPFSAGNETEQGIRAQKLSERGRLITVDAKGLSPKILANAIDNALALPVSPIPINTQGAETTARQVANLCWR